MFKLNLKIAWRNLLKHKNYTAVNIIGLALGLAGFIFIVLFINHEQSYDTWDPELENVYQMQEYSTYFSADKKAHWINKIDNRLSKTLADFPSVKTITNISVESRVCGLSLPNKTSFLQSGIRISDSLFFKVLPFEFKYGNADVALNIPNSIVLKESLALKYFGEINPLGKIIKIAGGPWRGSENTYTVTGVVKESKTPTIVNFQAIIFEDSEYFDVSGKFGDEAEVYVKMIPINKLNHFNETLQSAYLPIKDKFLQENGSSLKDEMKQGNAPRIKLTRLSDVYQAPLEKKSWKETLQPAILLSILLLVVSIINFINLATVQAASRAKEVGVKKVVGAYRKSIVLQFLTETFIQCLAALFIATLLIELSLPFLNSFFSLELSLVSNLPTIIYQLLAIIIVVGFLTGFYPAIFLSSYKPHEVLKGNFSQGRQNSLIRKGLVAVQFVISISFIIGILVINYQLKYLKERDNGFTATGLLNIKADLRYKDYYEQLKRIDGVKHVGYSSSVIGDNSIKANIYKYSNETIDIFGVGLSIDGLQTLDARLLNGRFFSSAIVQDTINNAVINETAAKLFHKDMVGQTIMANDTVAVTIIGVIKDLQVEGFDKAVKPSIYHVQTDQWKKGVSSTVKQSTLVRFDLAKTKEVLAGIDKIFLQMNEFFPSSYSFVKDDLTGAFIAHERFEKMVALFSLLSLLLSLFGLFSLSAFVTKQRTKEIAVRKVLGAENLDVLVLLNKGYLWIVLIANVIAFPLSYVLVNKWLSTFAYRIDIGPLPFVVAFIASVGITIITVSLQARKAVKVNPVKALKYE